TNPSPYTDEAVSVLQFYNPGCMRLLLNIGDTARNRMAPRMLTYQSESADNHGGKGVKTDGHAFFALCKELNCAPWIELPGNMVRDDILWMMEYVAGDGTTAGGADRIAWGQVEPWTDVLPSIYIDLGNESATFNGRSPDVASNYWEGLISAAKASPHYDSKVKFFIQGQGAAYLNVPNTPSADGLHQHGYIGRSLDLQELEDYLYTDELLFKFIWAHPYWLATVDAFASPGSLGSLADNYGLMPVAYETGNYHYTFGDAPSEVRDRFIAGIGGQISAFNLMLFRQKEYGFMAQNKFNFSQNSFIGTGSFGDGAEARLWGNIISPVNPPTRRYRPGYLAGHLANEVIYGDMMVTAHLGNDPTFDSTGLFKNRKLTNRGPEITVEDVPELYTYAFKDGDKRSIVMTLLSFEDRPVQLDFAGGALNQQATVRMLTGPAVDANNEPDFGPSEAQVFVTESVLTDFESGYQITVPKYSMMSIEWTEDGSGSNVAPVAEAGPDQAIVDHDGSGSEQVALNGFSSSDPDGSIVAYVWRENGSDLSGIANPVVTLPVGVHTLYLTVTDNQGATNTDTLTVEVIADTVPSITTAAFPAGSATRAYSAAVAVEGGNAPLTYSLLGAPAWMNIDPATGEITGTPPALGTFNPVVIVVDGDGDSDSISLQVTVGTPPAELYADDFADNDISDWTVIRDNGNDAWSAQDGAIYYPTNTGVFPIDLSKFNLIAYDGGSAWSDYTLEFDMVTVNDDDRMGAVVYFVDSENFLGTAANQQSNTYEIFKVEGGVYSELASMSGSYQTGVVESVTVTVENGGNLSVTDGTVNLSAPVPAGFTGGSIGFVTYYQQSTSFDNVVVTPLNPVVPNNAPIADAGNSLAVNDANDDGMANVSLDGSASSDNDGTIVSFVWKNGGSQIATGAAPAVALPVGAHTLELLVTDNAGATNADLVEVTVYGPASMAIIGTLAPFSNTEGSASLSQSLTVSGSNLVGDLIISAPSGFELSLDDSIYGPTLQMPASGGVVDPTVVYIRLADNPAGSYGGAINLGWGEANAVSSFTVEGTTTSAPAVPEPAVASLFVGLGVLLRVMRTRRR
ncbi:MAG: PKD domain-containing protein, partial [Opitutales bacterium]